MLLLSSRKLPNIAHQNIIPVVISFNIIWHRLTSTSFNHVLFASHFWTTRRDTKLLSTRSKQLSASWLFLANLGVLEQGVFEMLLNQQLGFSNMSGIKSGKIKTNHNKSEVDMLRNGGWTREDLPLQGRMAGQDPPVGTTKVSDFRPKFCQRNEPPCSRHATLRATPMRGVQAQLQHRVHAGANTTAKWAVTWSTNRTGLQSSNPITFQKKRNLKRDCLWSPAPYSLATCSNIPCSQKNGVEFVGSFPCFAYPQDPQRTHRIHRSHANSRQRRTQ